jgi:predicted nucleic acid-binding protein
MIVVDSSVWIDALNRKLTPQTRWLQRPVPSTRIGIPSLVMAEVLQGIRFENRFRAAEKYLQTFSVLDIATVPLVVQAARNFRFLRNIGITVRSTIDCLIATFCIENGHQLLHCDSDFDHFERNLGLYVLRPTSLP